jgi:hypothetical protein
VDSADALVLPVLAGVLARGCGSERSDGIFPETFEMDGYGRVVDLQSFVTHNVT